MNERIQELAEKCEGRTICECGEIGFNYEKFAELIVRDCLDIAFEVRGKPATDTHYVIGYDRACEKMIDAIKESYGVEE